MSAARMLVFGSLNYDYVYQVDHIVRPGETIAGEDVRTHCGGKGLNQAVALARAGADVSLAGAVGEDGEGLVAACRDSGVDTSRVRRLDGRSGHTVIQVDSAGENCIILYGGTNRRQTVEHVEQALGAFGPGDYLVLQNEVNLLPEIVAAGADRGMRVVLNPSPFDERVLACDLARVGLFLVNEVEGRGLTCEAEPEAILARMAERFPSADVVLTLGADGARARIAGVEIEQPAMPAKVVDTTGAGDTFTGYFLAELARSGDAAAAMRVAAQASAIAVSRPGAVPSIPELSEVRAALAGVGA